MKIDVPDKISAEWINNILYEGGPQYGFEDSQYEYDGDVWRATTLYQAAKEQRCKVFTLRLRQFDFSWNRYGTPMRVCDFAYHLRRALLTDLDKPILMGPMGDVMDGAHRLAMALAVGRETLPCLKLKRLPDPDIQRETA